MSIRAFVRKGFTDQRWSWMAHGFVTLAVAVVMAVTVRPAWSSPALAYALSATLVAALYVGKEQYDEMRKRAAGTYDTPDDRGVTGRVDKAGDVVGPVCVALSAWAAWFLGLA